MLQGKLCWKLDFWMERSRKLSQWGTLFSHKRITLRKISQTDICEVLNRREPCSNSLLREGSDCCSFINSLCEMDCKKGASTQIKQVTDSCTWGRSGLRLLMSDGTDWKRLGTAATDGPGGWRKLRMSQSPSSGHTWIIAQATANSPEKKKILHKPAPSRAATNWPVSVSKRGATDWSTKEWSTCVSQKFNTTTSPFYYLTLEEIENL